jgi:penicillin-binding protein 2
MTSVALVVVLVMIGQLGNLTLQQQAAYASQAEAQQTRRVPVLAPRGAIYDRNMRPLASSRPTFTLLLHFPYYKQPGVVSRLASILNVSVDELTERIEKVKGRPYQPAKLAENLTTQQVTAILEQKPQLPGAEVQTQLVRYYPNGDMAAQALGYVGEINESDLARLKHKVPGEIIGQTGLEAYYDEELSGKPGSDEVQVDIYGAPVSPAKRTAPTPGHTLVLTLDSELQRVAERALDWQMYRLQTIPNVGDGHAYPNAKAGAAVVMDVKTGAILAMASRPAFDLNLFVGGISQKDWDVLNNNSYTPLLNRTMQSVYQPGSTWKMMTGGAAVMAGVTTPYEQVFSGKSYEPTGQRDWLPWGHGWVDLPNALRLSSNIYFYEMGRRLGIDRLVKSAEAFGFGYPTGVDLGGEASGLMPDEAYREEHGWFLGQTTSAAIGQIFTVTPLQLARHVSAIANGGKLMQPYLVQAVQDGQGQVIRRVQPKQAGELPVSAEVLDFLVQGMKLVDGPTGTSDFAQRPLPGIVTAGKTGTAENPPKDDYGLYVGFAPADDPQIAVAVVIEQAGHGGSVSPVARSIYSKYFGVELPKSDPAYIPETFQPEPAPAGNHAAQ